MLVSARVDLFIQQQQWRRGVRVYSVSATAVADLQMKLACEMTISVTPAVLLPSVQLSPHVKQADIQLKDFRLKKLGAADGPVVHEVGEIFEGVVREQLHDKQQEIVKKINRSIEKNADRLRFSLAEMATSQWAKHFQPTKASEKKP